MVDADDAQRKVIGLGRQLHRDRRAREGGVDVVNWNRVVWVRGVTRDIAYDAQSAIRRRQRVRFDEWRDLGREVDAVDEDI